MDRVDLDELLDRELAQLPAPHAPETLLPRVLAAVEARRAAPPAATGWFTWSWVRRASALAALAALIAVAVALVGQAPDGLVRAARMAADTATVARAFWDVLLAPLAIYLFGLAVAFALACAAAWAAMELALGGASHQ